MFFMFCCYHLSCVLPWNLKNENIFGFLTSCIICATNSYFYNSFWGTLQHIQSIQRDDINRIPNSVILKEKLHILNNINYIQPKIPHCLFNIRSNQNRRRLVSWKFSETECDFDARSIFKVFVFVVLLGVFWWWIHVLQLRKKLYMS